MGNGTITGWMAQTLLDRIDNPKSKEGDTWHAGDVYSTLVAIYLEQNVDSVKNASGPQKYSVTSKSLEIKWGNEEHSHLPS